MQVEEALREALGALDMERVVEAFHAQRQFIFLPDFLPPSLVDGLAAEYRELKPAVHRSYVPVFKKGGAVSHYTLTERAPLYRALFKSPAYLEFMRRLTKRELVACPDEDPHATALYVYTEPGDQVGFHYDVCYYDEGTTYTVLIGIVDDSSARLEGRLFKDGPREAPEDLSIRTGRGSMVIFNGCSLEHRVTPIGEGEERCVYTMVFLTNPKRSFGRRVLANLDHALRYFGFSIFFRKSEAREG